MAVNESIPKTINTLYLPAGGGLEHPINLRTSIMITRRSQIQLFRSKLWPSTTSALQSFVHVTFLPSLNTGRTLWRPHHLFSSQGLDLRFHCVKWGEVCHITSVSATEK